MSIYDDNRFIQQTRPLQYDNSTLFRKPSEVGPMSKWTNPNTGFIQPSTPYQKDLFELDRRYGNHPSYQGQLTTLNKRHGINSGGGVRRKRKTLKKKSKKHKKSRRSSTRRVRRSVRY